MRFALLLALAACGGDFAADLATPRSDRCAEASAIYDTLPDRTTADAALVVAACL